MAKTITSEDLYVAITPYKQGTCTFNTICVSVSYRKGKGFYASVQPGWTGDDGIWGCVYDFSSNPLTASTDVLVKAASKNNTKLLEAMYANLCALPARQIVSTIFDMRDWNGLKAALYAIADDPTWATPERYQVYKGVVEKENINNNNNNQNITTMANENVKGAEYVGKVLVGNGYSYAIESINGDRVKSTYTKGSMSMSVNLKLDDIEKLLSNGQAHWQGEEPTGMTKVDEYTVKDDKGNDVKFGSYAPNVGAESADESDVQESDAEEFIKAESAKVVPIVPKSEGENTDNTDSKPVEAAAPAPIATDKAVENVATDDTDDTDNATETVAAPIATDNTDDTDAAPVEAPKPVAVTEKPKAKKSGKKGKYVFTTYQTKKGKTGGEIQGFDLDDAIYSLDSDVILTLHASKTWRKDKKGNRIYCLLFGPRYRDAAEQVCEALNNGAGFDELKAIVDGKTAERAAKREEWKAKRAEYIANREAKANEPKTVETPKDAISKESIAGFGDFLRKVLARDPDAMALAEKFMAA